MKTAISLPDPLFEAAEAASKRLGMSRSQFYAMALTHFLAAKDRSDITRQLNDVYSKELSVLDPHVARRQAESIGTEEW
jgi:metal-responsive CopG/Arc/MetJ family transcriptional regulator